MSPCGFGTAKTVHPSCWAGGRQIGCPTLMMWSSDDDLADLYGDPLEIWEPWAPDLGGGSIKSGHHMAEDAAEALAAALKAFLTADAPQ